MELLCLKHFLCDALQWSLEIRDIFHKGFLFNFFRRADCPPRPCPLYRGAFFNQRAAPVPRKCPGHLPPSPQYAAPLPGPAGAHPSTASQTAPGLGVALVPCVPGPDPGPSPLPPQSTQHVPGTRLERGCWPHHPLGTWILTCVGDSDHTRHGSEPVPYRRSLLRVLRTLSSQHSASPHALRVGHPGRGGTGRKENPWLATGREGSAFPYQKPQVHLEDTLADCHLGSVPRFPGCPGFCLGPPMCLEGDSGPAHGWPWSAWNQDHPAWPESGRWQMRRDPLPPFGKEPALQGRALGILGATVSGGC